LLIVRRPWLRSRPAICCELRFLLNSRSTSLHCRLLYWLPLLVRRRLAIAYCCTLSGRYAPSCLVALRNRSRLIVEAERPRTRPIAR
jgi:hypothetical protein